MKRNSITHWMAVTALLMAFVIVIGYIPKVPTPVGNIYWCDGAIIIAAMLTDPVSAFLSGGVSMLLYDLMVGSAYMAPVSLVIHGLQAVVISVITHYVFPKKDSVVKSILAVLAGVVIVVSGYFIYRSFISGGEKSGVAYALSKMPANFIQEGVGIAIAFVVIYAFRLKKVLEKNRLLPAALFDIIKSKAQKNSTEAEAQKAAPAEKVGDESAEGYESAGAADEKE